MSNIILPSGVEDAGGYSINRSVRLRSSASAYLTRTETAAATSNQKMTYSAWVKRGQLGIATAGSLFDAGADASCDIIRFSTDNLQVWFNAATSVSVVTTAVYRDPSAWYHIVVSIDTTQATAANRILIYVNGVVQATTGSQPGLNATFSQFNQNGVINRIGYYTSTYFDGYIAEVNVIDGQALTPSAFGEYDSVRNTQWKPKKYTGTYGTNGFYLNFSDNSAATAAALGKDSSGNSNNWTPNNVSVTAGVTYDSMTDVPTLTSATNANFAVMNPLSIMGSGNTLTNGNLTFSGNGSSNIITTGTFGMSSGKWYVEATITNGTGGVGFGIARDTEPRGSATVGNTAGSWGYNSSTGGIANNSSNLSTGATYTTGDVVAFALDMDAGTLVFYKNNSAQGSTVTGLSGTFTIAVSGYLSTVNINCGQRPFSYTPPSGFLALNTFNLPDGNVTSSDDYHKIYTYTGNGGGLQVGEVQKPASLFNLDRSLRFRSSATPYFTRTPASAGSQTTWTWSGWVKRGALGVRQFITMSGTNPNPTQVWQVEFDASDKLNFYNQTINTYRLSTRVFRDPSAWYHIVFCADTNNATAQNRFRCWVNGVEITAWDTNSVISSGYTFAYNGAYLHGIGAYTYSGNGLPLDGYLADVYFIDGQALTPSSFGDWDGNYYWTPKAYTGTYGTNGFHLDFEDFSAATAAAIGKDTSGNNNNWTPSAGINLTVPSNTNASWDSMVDVPTLTSADVANFCTLNPLSANTSTLPTQGNLYLGNNAVNNFACVGTIGVSSGKWYWELTPDSGFSQIGVTTLSALPANTTLTQTGSLALAVYGANGQKYDNGANTAYGASFTTTNVIGVALDLDAGTLTFYKDGVSQGVAFSGLRGTYYPVLGSPNTYNSGYINFGQRPFKYSNYGVDRPASTFKPINSFNIAEVTGDLESPDFVWIKSRSAGTHHALFNSVVGAGKYLQSSNAVAEVTDVNSLIQFNKNGFLLGNAAIVNTLAATYVASAWKVAATTVTNTQGTITSQVRVNPTAGISVVTWTGNGVNNSTVGHGFTSIAPKVIFAKRRDAGSNWIAMHTSLAADNNLFLSGTGLTQAISAISGGGISTTVANTTFTVKQGTTDQTNVNASGATYEAICFAEIPGFSKFTSYAANASATDGPFVYCGFRPRWLMIKRATGASGTGGWIMHDTERDPVNTMGKYLFAEGAAGDGSAAAIDATANGFKLRTNNVHSNQTSGDIYLVMAFAEHPFKYALAR